MKWLFIIAILIILAGGMLWLRTVRQGPEAASSGDPHRMDESVTPSGDEDNPLPPSSAAGAGGATGGPAANLPSSSTWAGEEAGPGEPNTGEDLPPSETRPQA